MFKKNIIVLGKDNIECKKCEATEFIKRDKLREEFVDIENVKMVGYYRCKNGHNVTVWRNPILWVCYRILKLLLGLLIISIISWRLETALGLIDGIKERFFPVPPQIKLIVLAQKTVGHAHNQQFISIGTEPITWTHTSGSLPTGLTLCPTGRLSGIPTQADTFSFTVTASNRAGSDSRTFTITVNEFIALSSPLEREDFNDEVRRTLENIHDILKERFADFLDIENVYFHHEDATVKTELREDGRFYGTFTFHDGAIAQGYVEDGWLVQGTLTLPDGTVLDGKFRSGAFICGLATFPDKTTADGDFINGKFVYGTFTRSDGATAYGNFENGVFVNGTFTFPDGLIEYGDFVDGWLIYGTRQFPDGTVEYGKFENGRLIRGTATSPEGIIFDGEFDENGAFMRGTIIYPDGTIVKIE